VEGSEFLDCPRAAAVSGDYNEGNDFYGEIAV
jgi:hypothetical protein